MGLNITLQHTMISYRVWRKYVNNFIVITENEQIQFLKHVHHLYMFPMYYILQFKTQSF